MERMEIKNVKGTFDYLPKEQRIRNYVTGILREVFELYGYQPIETPTLYYYDVLASKYGGGAEILKEVYRLQDQGKRDLALRYDLTVPFAKLISLSKDLQMPFKRYEIGKVFRDGPVKVGRNREFIQCDVDVVGIRNPLIDAELISLYVMAFQRFQIDFTVDYNNRKLMTGILEICGISSQQMVSVITVIDKFKKLTKEEIHQEFLNCGMTEEQIELLYEYFHLGFDGVRERLKDSNNEHVKQGLEELSCVKEYLEHLGIASDTTIDLTLARGLDIYTGTVFEVFAKNSKVTSAIGGGGRYDHIITNFIADGNEYPAIGCSFGLDAICEIIKEREDALELSNVDVFLVPLETSKETLLLATELRKRNIRVDIQYQPRKLNKVFATASRNHIPFVIVIGTDEVRNQTIHIRSMEREEEISCGLKDYDAIEQIILASRLS